MKYIWILLLLMLPVVTAQEIKVGINNPEIMFANKEVGDTIGGIIQLYNPNDFNVNITISAPGFYTSLPTLIRELAPNQTTSFNFKLNIPKEGNWQEPINVFYYANHTTVKAMMLLDFQNITKKEVYKVDNWSLIIGLLLVLVIIGILTYKFVNKDGDIKDKR